MSKIDSINELIKNTLAESIIGEVESPNFLITITRADCSPDLSRAKIFVSVLPNNFSGTALRNLRNKSVFLSKILKNRARLTKNLYLEWFIDEDLKKMEKIDNLLDEINRE